MQSDFGGRFIVKNRPGGPEKGHFHLKTRMKRMALLQLFYSEKCFFMSPYLAQSSYFSHFGPLGAGGPRKNTEKRPPNANASFFAAVWYVLLSEKWPGFYNCLVFRLKTAMRMRFFFTENLD